MPFPSPRDLPNPGIELGSSAVQADSLLSESPVTGKPSQYFRNINNLIYADDTTLMAESEEKLKSLLMKVKVESELKHTSVKLIICSFSSQSALYF